MDRQKTSEHLNTTLNERELTDVSRTLKPRTKYTFILTAHRSFPKRLYSRPQINFIKFKIISNHTKNVL